MPKTYGGTNRHGDFGDFGGRSGGVNLDPEQRARHSRRERRQERNDEQRIRRVERRAKRAEDLASQDDTVSLIETVPTLPDPTADYLGRSLLLRLPGGFRSTVNTAVQLEDDSIVWVEMEQGSVTGLFAWTGDIGVSTVDFDVATPTGIDIVPSSGDVWVVDYNNIRIRRYNPDGTLAATAGVTGSGAGQFNALVGLAVSPAGDVWVSDFEGLGNPYKIQKHNGTTGAYISEWATGASVSARGIGFNQAGTLVFVTDFVNDSLNDCIRVYNTAGVLQTSFGAGTMFGPTGVATDSVDNIYVADSRHQVVRKYNASYILQQTWGIPDSAGNAPAQFDVPWGVAVDNLDRVYVADRQNNRIQVFDSNGNYITKIGAVGAGPGQLSNPIAVTAYQGHVYIVDASNDRISHWVG